jgi:hypothetical protein
VNTSGAYPGRESSVKPKTDRKSLLRLTPVKENCFCVRFISVGSKKSLPVGLMSVSALEENFAAFHRGENSWKWVKALQVDGAWTRIAKQLEQSC